HRVRQVRFDSARHEVPRDNASGVPIDDNQLEHLRSRKHLYFSHSHLAQQRLVCSEQKLLACLATSVEGSRNLCASEGTVCQRATVLSGEGNTLRYALINDVQAELRQTVDVGFAAAEVAAF